MVKEHSQLSKLQRAIYLDPSTSPLSSLWQGILLGMFAARHAAASVRLQEAAACVQQLLPIARECHDSLDDLRQHSLEARCHHRL